MTEKRFNVFDVDGTIFLEDHKEGSYHIGEIGNVNVNCLNNIANRLNVLYEEKEQLTKENNELKQLVDLFAQDICDLTEILLKNQLDYKLHSDVENFMIKWGIRIE